MEEKKHSKQYRLGTHYREVLKYLYPSRGAHVAHTLK